MHAASPNREVPTWARVADVIILLLIVSAIVVAVTGGYRTTLLGLRFSVTSGTRLLLWAAALAAIRHRRIPRHPILRRLRSGDRDDDQFFGEIPQQRRWHAVAVASAAVLLTVAMTWPQAALLHSVPDIGDPLLSTWRTAWIAHQLPRDPLHLFDANVFHPEKRTLAFSDSMIVPALLAAPLLWAGVHQVVAYNLVFLSSFVLAMVFMFLFVRRLVGHTGAAIVAALIFGFYPYRFEHYSHLELQMSFWMPLGLWAFHRVLVRGTLRDGVLMGLAVAAQTLSSMYYGLFLATYLMPLAVVLSRARGLAPGTGRSLAAGGLVVAIIVAPVSVPYLQNRGLVGERNEGEVRFYSATPKDYFSAHPRSTTWGWMQGPNMPERQLFPGALAIGLAIAGLLRPLSNLQLAYAAALALAFDLSLGFNGFLYPLLYAYAFPYRGLRVPARFSVLVGFTLAVFAAWGVRRIAARIPSRVPSLLVPAVLAAGILLEYRPSITLEPVWKEPPPAYDRVEPSAVIAEFPTPVQENLGWFDTKYMYFSTFHWRRLVNGNSGFLPPSYLQFIEQMESFPGGETLAYLRARDVDYLIVHGAFLEPDEYLRVRAELDARSDLSMVNRFEWEGREGSLYRLVAGK